MTMTLQTEEWTEPEPIYQSIVWDADGYGSPQNVVVATASTFLGLRRAIRDQRWSREIHSAYDCTGREFCRTAKILHVGKTDAGYSAVLLVTQHFDV